MEENTESSSSKPEVDKAAPEVVVAPEPKPEEIAVPPSGEAVPPTEPTKPKSKRGVMIVAILVVVIAVVSSVADAAYNYFYVDSPTAASPTPTPSASASVAASASPSSSASATTTLDTGVKWLTPAKLADLNLFKIKREGTESQNSGVIDVAYYKIGTNASQEDIILAEVTLDGPTFYLTQYRFIKNKTGQYRLVLKNSADVGNIEASDQGVFDKDNTTHFLSLDPDATITNGTTKLVRGSFIHITTGGAGIAFNPTNETVIQSTKWGNLYKGLLEVAALNTTPIKMYVYYFKLPDTSRVAYQPKPTFLNDDGTFTGVTFSNTALASAKFSMMRSGGCGVGANGFPAIASDASFGSQKVLLDKSTHAYKLYGADSKDSTLITYAYELYSSTAGAGEKSAAEYYAANGAFGWTDAYGSTVAFINNDLAPQAECGKPVIYLYPKTETKVSVKVGAKITKSDPTYANGWEVIANPDGKLEVGGQKYFSLFWEGLGYGEYPAIKSGVVVPSYLAAATIIKQMQTMGFNSTEINDFMEFWRPKLPKTTFTRLTWLQTEEMNALAPLAVNPKPESTLRAFLDFAGVSKRVELPTQKLNHIDRNGFTLVEWGGLLTNSQLTTNNNIFQMAR